MISLSRVGLTACVAGVATPALAFGAGDVLLNANAFSKLVLALIVGLGVGCLIVAARKLRPGADLDGGSPFVAAVRLAAPLLGLAGASHIAFTLFIALAQVGDAFPMAVSAPAVAEALLIFIWGLVAGLIAVVCHWGISARLERALLRS